MKTFIICPICDARGYIIIDNGISRRCSYCKGKGIITYELPDMQKTKNNTNERNDSTNK